MTSDTFNQLLNDYRQQVIETSTAAANGSPVSHTPSPTWLQILQRHVQEWKQHYSLESQAVQQVKQKHISSIFSSLSSGSPEQGVLVYTEDQELTQVTKSFQAKRESIWIRQQQELSNLGIRLD